MSVLTRLAFTFHLWFECQIKVVSQLRCCDEEMKRFVLITLAICVTIDLFVLWMLWWGACKEKQHPDTSCRESLTFHFPLNLKLYIARPSPWSQPSFRLASDPVMCGCAKKLCCVHDLRCVRLVIAFATAVALAGCTSDGTPPSTGDSGTGSGFMRNLFNSKSEDQPPVPHNEVPSVAHSETPVEPTAPKKKSVKPKQSTVAVARVPKEEARAQPQSPPESAAPALSGAAPVLATGSFDNRVGSRR
jgi:hypothetical protein